MRPLALITTTLLFAMGAMSTLSTPTNQALTNPPSAKTQRMPSSTPPSLLPPADTPCDETCICTLDSQFQDGQLYCGFCAGVSSRSGVVLPRTDVVRCMGSGSCCSYGYLDGRCDMALLLTGNMPMDGLPPLPPPLCPRGFLQYGDAGDAEQRIAGGKQRGGEFESHHGGRGDDTDTDKEASPSVALPPPWWTSTVSLSLVPPTPTDPNPNPLPPSTQPCDPNCTCAEAHASVPLSGRMLCGWCGPVSGVHGTGIDPEDVIHCKEHKCCNYGFWDGRCNATLADGRVPDWATFCDWPVLVLDPEDEEGTYPGSTGWGSLTEGGGTRGPPVVTVTEGTAASGEGISTVGMVETTAGPTPAVEIQPRLWRTRWRPAGLPVRATGADRRTADRVLAAVKPDISQYFYRGTYPPGWPVPAASLEQAADGLSSAPEPTPVPDVVAVEASRPATRPATTISIPTTILPSL